MYSVNKFHIDAKVNNTEVLIDSFSVGGSGNITAGTSDANFNVTYLTSSSNSVTYRISKGTFSENATIYSSSIFGSSIITSPTSTDSNVSASNDIATSTLPFILPVSGKSDPLWTELDNTTFPDSSASVSQGGLSISSSIKSTITSDHFEVSENVKMSGSLLGSETNIKITANIVYELATGVLLGFKADITLDTSSSGTTTSENANIEVTRSDYKFSSSGLPGFESMPFIFSMFIISIIILK